MTSPPSAAPLVTGDTVSFADLVAVCYERRYTGSLTLHFMNGVPQAVEVGRPVLVRFSEAGSEPRRADP